MRNQIDMVKNELRHEMKTSIQTPLSNQTNEIKNMMASLLQMNTASTSGSGTLPGNTIANPKGELKAITTRNGLVTEGSTIPNPPKSVNPEEDECVEETYTDPDHAEYNIKVLPPPPVQKPKPPIQRNFVIHTRDSLPPYIPYPSRMLKQKQQEKDDIQIQKFWNMFKQLHLNITLAEALMTLELANRVICTPDGIARDVFVPIGKFTFLADFVIVDYESDPRVPLILGRPFLRTARALIDVHGEEMILHDGDERLTLNMKHDTASYSNHPYRESVNLINIFNISSEYCLKDLVTHKQSGNPTFSLHKEIASPEVIPEIHDSKGCTFLSEEFPDIDSLNDIHPYFDDDPLSGSTTFSANSLLEEFADELALISYPPDYDDNRACDIESDIREIEFLLFQGEDSDFDDSIDQSVLTNRDDLFVDPKPEMFNDEQPPDYSFPPRFDVVVEALHGEDGKICKKVQPRLYALESMKNIEVASKLSHGGLEFSFRCNPRGGVEQYEVVSLLEAVATCQESCGGRTKPIYKAFNARPFWESPRPYFSEQFYQLFTTFTKSILADIYPSDEYVFSLDFNTSESNTQ
nr:reverse transcriptase domain-containing protein [Tanacetum cinerariifolium]